MDDLFKETTPQDLEQKRKEENWHSEQARRAHDIIRIANPVNFSLYQKNFVFAPEVRQEVSPQFAPNGDYLVVWENLRYRIPLNGTFEIDRYIAAKYCREMFTCLINYYGNLRAQELLEIEGRNRPEVLLDKYLENKAVWDKTPRTDDQKLMAEVYPQLWLGIVRENGLDDFQTNNPRSGEVDLKTPEERIMEQLGGKRASEPTIPSVFADQPEIAPILPPNEPTMYDKRVANMAKAREARKAKLAQAVTDDN